MAVECCSLVLQAHLYSSASKGRDRKGCATTLGTPPASPENDVETVLNINVRKSFRPDENSSAIMTSRSPRHPILTLPPSSSAFLEHRGADRVHDLRASSPALHSRFPGVFTTAIRLTTTYDSTSTTTR